MPACDSIGNEETGQCFSLPRGRGEGSRDRSIKATKGKKKKRNDFSTITSFWRSLFLGGKGGAVLCFRLIESRFIGQPVKVGVSRVISAGGSRRGNRIESSIVLSYARFRGDKPRSSSLPALSVPWLCWICLLATIETIC